MVHTELYQSGLELNASRQGFLYTRAGIQKTDIQRLIYTDAKDQAGPFGPLKGAMARDLPRKCNELAQQITVSFVQQPTRVKIIAVNAAAKQSEGHMCMMAGHRSREILYSVAEPLLGQAAVTPRLDTFAATPSY
jgi:hypothetical protein